MKNNKKINNIILIFLSLIIGLCISEASLRFFKIEYPIFYKYDFHRGFALRPNAQGTWLKEGKAFIKINSDGLRDKEYSKIKSENIFRIAVVGDSFAEARSVPMDKTFWFLMEKNLNNCSKINNQKIEVINFGVTEYSTAQELLTVRHHVWSYDPNIILVTFFSGNDISDNSKKLSNKNYRPFFVYKDNNIVLDNSFRKSNTYLFLKSEIGQFIVKISSYLRTVQALKEFDLNNYFKNIKKNNTKNKLNKTDYLANIPLLRIKELYSPTEKSWLEAWNLTESIIKLMNREIENKGAKMVVVTASTPIQVYPDASVRKSFISKNDNLDLFYPDKRIKKLGKKENFKVINLAQILKDYAEKNQVFLHGFDNTELGTGHWNIKGHNAAGEIISNELCNTFSH